MSKRLIAAAVMGIVLLTACGGNGGSESAPDNPATEVELRDLLLAELAARGIDPAKAASKAPSGPTNRTLVAYIYMSQWEPSPENPQWVSFRMGNLLPGDANANGEVNISDLSIFAGWMGATAVYRDPAEVHGQTNVPDPNYYYGSPFSDGDRNGRVTISDLSAMGAHYGERLDGWHVYYKQPSDADFQIYENPDNPGEPMLFPFSPGLSTSAGFQVTQPGTVEFYAVSYDGVSDAEGEPSPIFSLTSNNLPQPQFTVSASTLAAGEVLVLDGSATTDPDGDALTYGWRIDQIEPPGSYGGVEAVEADIYSSVHKYRLLRLGTYEVTLTVTDERGASVPSATELVTVDSVQGARNPAWVFSTAMDVGNLGGGTSDLQEIAGRAAFITVGYDGIYFASAPPDGSAWTTPVVALPNPDFVTVGPSLGEVAGHPAVSGSHFYSINSLIGGGPLEYARALDPQGASWPAPVVLSGHIFADGLTEVGGEPYVFSTNFPFTNAFWLYHGADPNGSDLERFGQHDFAGGEVEGSRFTLRSNGADHYVVNLDRDFSEIWHSSDLQTWTPTAGLPNPLMDGNSAGERVSSTAYILGTRLALVWKKGSSIYYSVALDNSATQWIPIKQVVTDAGQPTNNGASNDLDGLGLALVDGVPTVAYSDVNNVLKLVRATNSNGTVWDSAGAEVLSNYGVLKECDLAVIGDRPALTVHNFTTGQIEYAYRP